MAHRLPQCSFNMMREAFGMLRLGCCIVGTQGALTALMQAGHRMQGYRKPTTARAGLRGMDCEQRIQTALCWLPPQFNSMEV